MLFIAHLLACSYFSRTSRGLGHVSNYVISTANHHDVLWNTKTIKDTKYCNVKGNRRTCIAQGQENQYVLLFTPHESKWLFIPLNEEY